MTFFQLSFFAECLLIDVIKFIVKILTAVVFFIKLWALCA